MRRAQAIAAALLAVLCTAATGCGDDSAPASGSAGRPLVAHESSPSSEAAEPGQGGTGKSAYEQIVAGQSAHPRSRFSPCNLVTRGQARAIVGRTVRQVEASQGPTCIYQAGGGGRSVTLAVQTVDFGQVKARLRGRRMVDAAGRKGYCGQYGQDVLYVPLTRGRVLAVGGSCAVAQRFAEKAVPRLRG